MTWSTVNDRMGGIGQKRKKTEDITSCIFHILKDYATASRIQHLELKSCEAMVIRKRYFSTATNMSCGVSSIVCSFSK